MPEVHGKLANNMKKIIDGKEYDVEPICTSPFENPKNPKYVSVNGYVTPVDTTGPHRPLPFEGDVEKSVDGMFDLATVSRGTKPIKVKPIVPRLISLRYPKR